MPIPLNEEYQAIDEGVEGLYGKHVNINSVQDLSVQRGTPVPALFNIFYKFIQNPSTVSITTFKRMVDTDDTIGSGMDFLVTLLAARLGSYRHASQEVTEWVNKALSMVEGGFHDALKEMLSDKWAGMSVTEKTWANTDHGFIVERLSTLPPDTILFEVDRVGRLTPDGILQYQRAYNPAILGASGIFGSGFSPTVAAGRPDPFAKFGDFSFPLRVSNIFNYLSIRIPKQKVIHLSNNAQGRFHNPYGRSLLRRAYNFWVMKNAFLQMLANAMDRKGTPILVVFADPNATIIDPSKVQNGNIRGQPGVGIRPEQAALNAFANIHNDSVVVLPGKKDQVYSVDPVQVQSNAADFIAAIDRCDKGALRAMLIPSLIFTNGDGTGSNALGQEHAKTFEKVLDSMLVGTNQALIDQYIKEMIMYNFPESVWKKDGFGAFNKRDFTQDEINKIMEGYTLLQSMGAIDMGDLNDLNKVREAAGFDLRTKVLDSFNEELEQRWGGKDGPGAQESENPEEVQNANENNEGDANGDKNKAKPAPQEEKKIDGKKLPKAMRRFSSRR